MTLSKKGRDRSVEKKAEPKFDTSLSANIPIQTLNSSHFIQKEHENYLASKTGFGENNLGKDTVRTNTKLVEHLATLKRIIDEQQYGTSSMQNIDCSKIIEKHLQDLKMLMFVCNKSVSSIKERTVVLKVTGSGNGARAGSS